MGAGGKVCVEPPVVVFAFDRVLDLAFGGGEAGTRGVVPPLFFETFITVAGVSTAGVSTTFAALVLLRVFGNSLAIVFRTARRGTADRRQ